ncbi:MAG TPA: hypothetical protein VHA15_01610 [Burkholderiales bacterium]|nr:hypothetical protein [Burkholderiales bacterium]
MTRHLHTYGLPEEYLTAIGSITVGWAALDFSVARVIGTLIPASDAARDCVTGPLDTLPKVEILRALARVKFFHDDARFAAVDWLCSDIIQTLAPERNRCVHDMWGVGDDLPVRTRFKPELSKAPFKAARQISFHRGHKISLEYLTFLSGQMLEAQRALNLLDSLIAKEHHDGPFPWPDILQELRQSRRHPPAGSPREFRLPPEASPPSPEANPQARRRAARKRSSSKA